MSIIMQIVSLAGSIVKQEGQVEDQFVQEFDPDAHNGRGRLTATNHPQLAKRFNDMVEAWEYWKQQSKVTPFRPDGKPNRPLTAFTVTFREIK